MSIVGADLIKSEDQKFGVPDWLAFPLISAESSFQSDATNGQYEGLLQLGPDYPGVNGQNRLDPTTNLEIGLPPLKKALDAYAAGHPGFDASKPDNAAYDYVLTHSGHPTWTGDWAGQQTQFEKAYSVYDGPTSSPGTVFGPPLYNAGNAISGGALGAIKSFGDLMAWVQSHPGTLAVILAALLVFVGVSFHLVSQQSGGVVPV